MPQTIPESELLTFRLNLAARLDAQEQELEAEFPDFKFSLAVHAYKTSHPANHYATLRISIYGP